ncbi:type IV secretion protein Rhs [Amycolatopsis suaedae]|uniref:Type IV secretion protein Rhs n=2 Tax=Amycolatopsis suaedae TaxID=2510978 RepID=A0A4V2ELV3_9PSEU|nr:type IV secretion protein Rhs [Amycolatopsis suaedae]
MPLAESAADLKAAIESGDWAAVAMGAVGTALDTLGAVLDPFAAIISNGVGWLLEHVGPLKEALDALAGDPEEIKAHSETWKNVATELAAVGQDLTGMATNETAGWQGPAADTYRQRATDTVNLITAAQNGAEGASSGIQTAGEVVAAVRGLVRDIIADLVGSLISWALQVLFTLGIGMAWVVPKVVLKVAEVTAKIADVMKRLVQALKKFVPLVKKATDLFDDAKKALKNIKQSKPDTPDRPKDIEGGPRSVDKPGSDSTSASGASGGGGNRGPGGSDGTGPSGSPGSSGSPGDGPGPGPAGSRGGGDSTSASGSRGGNNGSLRDEKPNPRSPDNVRGCKDPIDVATGQMVLGQTDAEFLGVLPLVFERTHFSSYQAGRWFGRAWVSTVDQRLEVDGSGVTFAAADGTVQHYPHPAPGAPVTSDQGPARTLRRAEDGGYLIEERSETLYFAPGSSVLPLTSVTDRNGNRIEFGYDNGAPSEITHSAGYRIRIETTDRLVTALHSVAADGGETELMRYGYRAGRLTEVVNASGQALRFDYDQAGRITAWTDRNGEWYRYTYDAAGRCVRTEGSGGFLTGTMEYGDHVTCSVDSLGHRTEFHLNDLGQVIREVDPLGNVVVSEWDRFDRLLRRTDPLGRTTGYTYDDAGNLTAVTLPDGTGTRFEYGELGLPVTVVQPDGTVIRREYDERGNIARITDPAGAVTAFTHDEHGRLTGVTDALHNTWRVGTDPAGLPVLLTDPLGGTVRYERDAFGRVAAVTDPLGERTALGWTPDGKPAWREFPDGTTERWTYDGEGNLTAYTDRLGQTTRIEVTHFDLPSVQTRPDGTRLSFGYDTELRLTSVTNEQGLVWRYEYDAAGSLVTETDFNGRTITYRHDAAGQLVERTNGAGETTRFVRDALGNVVERHSPAATATFRYDLMGRLVEAADAATHVGLERDANGRVVAETVDGRTVASAYDALGRRVRRRTPSGVESVWEFDAAGRPVTLGAAGRTLRFGHDAAGQEIQRAFGDQVLLAQAWDGQHRLQSQTLTGAGGNLLQQRSYDYDPAGRLTGLHDQLTGPRAFTLDPADRVTGVAGPNWSEQYAYDAAGNVATAAWPSAPGQAPAEETGEREYRGTLLLRAGNVRYGHDAQGRMVLRQRKRLSRIPDTWQYFWDADDRLTGVRTPDGTQWRYRYDPLGRRAAKQRLNPDGSVAEQIDFVWDGEVVAEQAHSAAGGDTRVTAWDYEPGTFRPLLQHERSLLRHAPQQWVDERFYGIVTDLVGTPTEMIGEQGGVAWFRRTNLWGETVDHSSAGAYTPLRFPGQYHDPETGLDYNFHRHYDPSTGRYGSADPLGLAGGFRPHGYVDNPHAFTDPLGLTPCPAGRLNNALGRYGGVPHTSGAGAQGYMFPNRRSARQAAAEYVGQMGHGAQPIRMSDFRGDQWMRPDGVIGRQSADGSVGWRDDRMGHTFNQDGRTEVVGPHVNVWGPGVNHRIHFFYPGSNRTPYRPHG